MNSLLRLIFALFKPLVTRDDRRTKAARVLRDAPAERAKAPVSAVAARPSGPLPAPFAPAGVPAVVQPRRLPGAAAPAPEASLVTGLFANPASLAAAFIVGEVLAKPVALRDPMTPPGR